MSNYDSDSNFEPDMMVAEPARRYLQPEKKLMLGVLEDAIWRLRKLSKLQSLSKGQQEEREETEEWFLSDSVSELFGFRNICETLGWSYQKVRHKLLSQLKVQE